LKEAAGYVVGMETSATVMDGNQVDGLYPLDCDLELGRSIRE